MEVEEFPVLVCHDIHRGDLLEQGKAQWRRPAALES